jgi:hypothetical protein
MAVLNSKFDILRGWPDGSAIAEDFTRHTDAADKDDGVYRHGNFVALGRDKNGSGSFAYGASGSRTHSGAVAGIRLGLIIEGEEETSSSMSKTVTCLIGGGYMVRLHLEGQFSTNAYGNASIPGGRDQYVQTRPKSDDSGGDGLAAATAAGHAAYSQTQDAVLPIKAGDPITVIEGVACRADTHATSTELVIGTCLKVGSDFIEILVH